MEIKSRRGFDAAVYRQTELEDSVDGDVDALSAEEQVEFEAIGDAIIAWEDKCEERGGKLNRYGGD